MSDRDILYYGLFVSCLMLGGVMSTLAIISRAFRKKPTELEPTPLKVA